jgi:polyhydroxybutyrate depolymerase
MLSRARITGLAVVPIVAVASLAAGGCSGHNGVKSGGGPGVTAGEDMGPAAPTCSGKSMQASGTWTIMFGGAARSVRAHIPGSYNPAHGVPLILNFHGYQSDALEQELLTNMSAKSDASGFVVLYPEGSGSPESWNAGACCGDAAKNGTDDVGFTRAILDAAEDKLCIDKKRIFATGMSNGAFMSHRLGCELADRIAAIAPVAGVLGVSTCAPARPMPVMHFHGTADMLVPYDGDPMNGFISVPDSFKGWAMRDQCSGSPVETFQKMDASCSSYTSCAGGAEVTLCTIQNGGHTWPGGPDIPFGYTTPYLNATDAMWSFFQAHPLP